jgi:tetratricopeptide (TPR) repeat protein/AraC-like DNA-binding protein
MNEESSQDQSLLDRLNQILESHYEDEHFGVSELAREIGFSRSQLHRRLQSITSKSTSQIIREFRLEKAKEMLAKDVANVSEIAYRVGFGSPSYFITCFRDFYGYSPGETKKMVDAAPQRSTIKANRKLVYSAFLILVLLIVLSVIFFPKLKKSNKIELERSIAVMPFDNASADEENQYFVDGMMEDVRNNLALIGDLRVISKTSTEKYRKTDLTSKEIGQELNVNYILEGTVQKQGNQVKIHTQLIEAETDNHIWVNTFLEDFIDIFKIQSQIAESIAEELKATISPQVRQRMDRPPTENPEAYEIYLRAREYHSSYGNKSNLKTAIDLYQQALELDPEFALAWLYLGEVLVDETWFEVIYDSEYDAYYNTDTISYYINKALEIDPFLADAYMQRGIGYLSDGRYERGVSDLEKAIELDPNLGRAYRELGFYYSNKGEYIQALKLLERSRKISIGETGIASTLYLIGRIYLRIGDYEKANEIGQDLIKVDPFRGYSALHWLNTVFGNEEKSKFYGDKMCTLDSVTCLGNLSYSYEDSGNYEMALYYYDLSIQLGKTKGQYVWDRQDRRGILNYKLGRTEEALKLFDEWIALKNEDIKRGSLDYGRNWAYNDIGRIYAFMGERDKAFEYLYQMEENITGDILTYLHHDPIWENLWDDEEFKNYIQRNDKQFAELRAEIDRLETAGKL